MKITFKKGNRWKDDKLFFIESKEEEAFSMYRLLLLINQLAINEWGRNKAKGYIERGLPFHFEEAILSVIDLGKKGINLLEDRNDYISDGLCDQYQLNFETWKQTKLNDFFKENETP